MDLYVEILKILCQDFKIYCYVTGSFDENRSFFCNL